MSKKNSTFVAERRRRRNKLVAMTAAYAALGDRYSSSYLEATRFSVG